MDGTTSALTNLLFYCLLPASLVTAIIFRYNFIGVVYLILLICWPYNAGIRRAYSRRFSLVVLIFAGFFNLMTLVFQIIVFSTKYFDESLDACDAKDRIYRFLGLQPLKHADHITRIRLVVPDIFVFASALISYLMLQKLSKKMNTGSQETRLIQSGSDVQTETFLADEHRNLQYYKKLNKGLCLGSLCFLALSGIASPSLLSLPYLLLFLLLTTLYSFHMDIASLPQIYKLRIAISIYTAVHLVVLYIYQLQVFEEEVIKPNDLTARLLGLKQLVVINCTRPFEIRIAEKPKDPNGRDCVLTESHDCSGTTWPAFVEPVFILFLHFVCAFTFKVFNQLRGRPRRTTHCIQETDPLVERYREDILSAHSQQRSNNSGPRISIFASHFPPKKQITITMREKALYVFGLMMMMAWSVTYHSWITFVLLLWSCYLWMARNRDQVTLKHAKYITLYAIVLILLQFVYSLTLYDKIELPTTLRTDEAQDLKTLGLRRPEKHAFVTLLMEICFTLVFWLMIHEHIRQKFEKRFEKRRDQTRMPKLQTWILEQLARYFIIIVSAFLLFISLSGEVVGYKIIYMIFFLFSGIVFQLSWNIWHRILRVFWLVLVVYSILVVVLTYTFQLNDFISYWETITKLNKEELESLGLKKYDDGSDLMIKICMPTAFLVCCMLQLHYYHERFVILTEVDKIDDSSEQRPPTTNSVERQNRELRRPNPNVADKKSKRREALVYWWRKFSELGELVKRIMWKLLEIHRWKICAVTVVLSAVYSPSACYLFPVIIWILGLPFRSLDHFIYIVTLLWSSVILLLSMIYQLDFVNNKIQEVIYSSDGNNSTSKNCSAHPTGLSSNWALKGDNFENIDVLIWFGFDKVGKMNFCNSVRGWLAIIITLLAERVIFRRSRYLENMYPETKKAPGAIFPHITRVNADTNVKECFQFFANYFFHKFGSEVCFISTVITVWIRQDFWGSFYAIFLLILMIISFQSRKLLSKIWKPYTMMLSVIWAVQYIFILGLPPALCINYNWGYIFSFISSLEDEKRLDRFIIFMFLPKQPQFESPDSARAAALVARNLIPDFFQLLLAVCQCAVFDNESKSEWIKLAGSNEDESLDTVKQNPYPNFILAEPPTGLDRLKTFVFSMIYWVTFTIVLIAGTNRTSAFCLGYLVAAFYFLYQGQVIITSMPSMLRRRWNYLLFFAAAVIVSKCCLQYVACVSGNTERRRDIVLSLSCERVAEYFPEGNNPNTNEEKENTVGIVWDFATFVFLLIQRRIFQSYYFLHVRADLIVQMALSSKGNQLFSLWINQESKKRQKAEQDDKLRVEATIERIKSNLRQDVREPYDHFDALRVCDKSWFEDMSEDIYAQPSDAANNQTTDDVHDNTVEADDVPSVELSLTAEQLAKQDQSPKLPEGIRNFRNTIGNVLFTGRLGTNMTEIHESRETITEQPIPESFSRNIAVPNLPAMDDDIEGASDDPPAQSCNSCMITLGIELIIYLTRVLNTRTQAYRSIIIQLKKDRQEPWMDKLAGGSSSSITDQKYVPKRKCAELIKVEALRPSKKINRKKSNFESGDYEDITGSSENEICEEMDQPEQVKFISPDDFDKGEHYIQRSLSSIWYFGQFQIENVCYILMLFNGMLNASLLSLPFLGFIFLWAMLSVPRPSKRFWVTAICYTCLVIFIKYIFSFKIWRFYHPDEAGALNQNDPFWLPRIVGIELKPHLKYLDIAQLLVLFFQRGLLKVHGLWENYDEHFDKDDDCQTEDIFDKSAKLGKKVLGIVDNRNANNRKRQNCLTRNTRNLVKNFLSVLRSPGRFYDRLVAQEKERKNKPTDVYIWMLGFDFICFIIIMFGYWAFGKHNEEISGDITAEIRENVVPSSFLYLLFTHFFLILIDRAIYLKKNLVAKLLFHVTQVLALHIWMFFFLPYITEISFYKNHVAVALYTFKALYFAFSSHQIKCGYPTRILQHFLTKKFNYINLYVFIGYRLCPFIIEFQNIMDWMFVESTMGISRWFMLTTIYHELYQIKCWRVLEKQFHYPRGAPRWPSFKYSGGGFLLIVLILIMWFPLAFMSIVQTVAGVVNVPKELSVSVRINGYETMYSSSRSDLKPWSKSKYSGLEQLFRNDLGAQQFISRYESIDIYSTILGSSSKSLWVISPIERTNMIQFLKTDKVTLTFDYSIRRKPGSYEMASGYYEKDLDQDERANLSKVIQNDQTEVTIKLVYPQYIRALITNDARPIQSLQSERCYLGIKLQITKLVPAGFSDTNSTNSFALYYWQFNTMENKDCDTNQKKRCSPTSECQSDRPLDEHKLIKKNEMVIFSDRTGPESLAWLTGYGIIGLYLSVTLLCGRYTRAIFQYDGAYILFHEYPNVDSLLQLCLDLYLVREMKLWKLEEDLMAKLIYLYRSPETMLPFTKLIPYKPKHSKSIKQE